MKHKLLGIKKHDIINVINDTLTTLERLESQFFVQKEWLKEEQAQHLTSLGTKLISLLNNNYNMSRNEGVMVSLYFNALDKFTKSI